MSDEHERTVRKARAQTLLDLFSITVLLSPAVAPLLRDSPTCGWDNLLHLWRAVEVERFLSSGLLFSRWAPDMAGGYGYPLFNFTAPVSAYGPAILHLLGLRWPLALNLTFALGWVLSAMSIYVFTRDVFDRRAGLVASAIYAYVPFHAYDVFYRGGLSQSTAWVFPPLIMWGLRHTERRIGFATAALGLAALILTHNAFALLFCPLILTYAVAVGLERGREAFCRGIVACLTALGLTTFFWLPALVELRFVHSERITGDWVFEYTNNFLSVDQLFPVFRTAYNDLINDWPERGLGAVPALLAILGVASLVASKRWLQAAFWGTAFASALLLTTVISRPIWDALSLLQRVQFPWRLVGPAAFCAAVLGAALANTLHRRSDRLGSALTLLLILTAVIPHLGWFHPRHCDPPADISVAGMLRFEKESGTIGTTSLGEFLPIWVKEMPPAMMPELGNPADTSCDRLDRSTFGQGTTVLRSECRLLETIIIVDTSARLEARYKAFFYPGWQVWIDERNARVVPTEPEGWLSFEVPPGRHTIRVRFGETSLRCVTDLVSLATGLLFAIVLIRWKSDALKEVSK